MSVTAGPPFNSSTDPNIAVAYVSAFIFVFFVSGLAHTSCDYC